MKVVIVIVIVGLFLLIGTVCHGFQSRHISKLVRVRGNYVNQRIEFILYSKNDENQESSTSSSPSVESPASQSILDSLQSPQYYQSLKNRPIEEIMDELEDIPQDNLPPQIMNLINQKISADAPSRLEMMKTTLGITPFTIGLAIACGMMLALNGWFGDGWAGELLGYNSKTVEYTNSMTNPDNQEKINKMKLNNKINLEDAIQRFQMLEKDEHAFDEEGDPNIRLKFQNLKEEDLVLPDFIVPE